MTSATVVTLEDLLLSVAAGDRQAFRRLYGAAKAELYGICVGMFRDRERADEAFQDACVRIWKKADQFDPAKGRAIAWMATITRRCVLDRLRLRGRAMIALDSIDPNSEALIAALPTPAAGAGRDLKRCLERLDPDQARSIVLAFVYGLTHEELASTMSRPLGTVKSWIRRGLGDLKDCMAA